MYLKILVINILLFLLNETYAYQTRKCECKCKSKRTETHLTVEFRQIKTHKFPFQFAGILSELCPASDSITKTFNTFMRNMPEVHLGENDQSAALVQFSWNSSNFKRYDDCRFRVIATIDDNKSRNRGVFVSIRRLNLRKNLNSEDCVDYIRFKFGDTKSPKYCGQLNASIDDVKKIYFGEGGGRIEVFLYLNKFQPLPKIDDTLDVELVFTANEGTYWSRNDLAADKHTHTHTHIPWVLLVPANAHNCVHCQIQVLYPELTNANIGLACTERSL